MRGNLKSSTRICFNHPLEIKSRILVSLRMFRTNLQQFFLTNSTVKNADILFQCCRITKRTFHLYGKPGLNSGENSSLMVYPLQKCSYHQRYCLFSLLLEFPEISVPLFLNQQYPATPRRQKCSRWRILKDESLQFSKPFMTCWFIVVINVNRILTTQLQPSSSKTFQFLSQVLGFTFAFTIRAFEQWRAKTNATESSDRMIRLNPFLFFLLRQSAIPVV